MFRLTVSLAGRPVQHFNFDQDSVCIGRDPDCEIPVDNLGISRRHATVERADGGFVLTDLKSHNGTFVQGRRVNHHRLADNDEFFIGKYTITFENLETMSPDATRQVPPERTKSRMQDMTFQLDRDEIEKLVTSAKSSRIPKFTQFAPESEERTIPLEKYYYLLGSSASAAVRIGGFRMPPIAAALIRNDGAFHVVALGRKKVLVNGMAVADQQLADGDVVEIGRRKFRFARA